MTSDDWYRSSGWSRRDRDLFEAKLTRAAPHNQPQYLRIKGFALIGSRGRRRREAGFELLRRVIREFPDSTFDVSLACDALAEAAAADGDIDAALEWLRSVIGVQLSSGVRTEPELRLAELIIGDGRVDLYHEAQLALDALLADNPIVGSTRFRYAVARARLSEDPDQAAAFACGALHLAAINAPFSSRHPTLGLIKTDRRTVTELERIAVGGDPEAASPIVDDFRAPDGAVVWDWELIRRLLWTDDDPLVMQEDAFRQQSLPILQELREAGVHLVNIERFTLRALPTAAEARTIAAILLRGLERSTIPDLQGTLARALADPRVRLLAAQPLLERFAAMRDPSLNGSGRPSAEVGAQRRLKSALASALSTLARDAQFELLATLIRDRAHGGYRVYLLSALEHVKRDEAVDLVIEALGDEEIFDTALYTLAAMKSDRAEPYLAEIAARPRPAGRSEEAQRARRQIDVAQKGLERLHAARARGKHRP